MKLNEQLHNQLTITQMSNRAKNSLTFINITVRLFHKFPNEKDSRSCAISTNIILCNRRPSNHNSSRILNLLYIPNQKNSLEFQKKNQQKETCKFISFYHNCFKLNIIADYSTLTHQQIPNTTLTHQHC